MLTKDYCHFSWSPKYSHYIYIHLSLPKMLVLSLIFLFRSRIRLILFPILNAIFYYFTLELFFAYLLLFEFKRTWVFWMWSVVFLEQLYSFSFSIKEKKSKPLKISIIIRRMIEKLLSFCRTKNKSLIDDKNTKRLLWLLIKFKLIRLVHTVMRSWERWFANQELIMRI